MMEEHCRDSGPGDAGQQREDGGQVGSHFTPKKLKFEPFEFRGMG